MVGSATDQVGEGKEKKSRFLGGREEDACQFGCAEREMPRKRPLGTLRCGSVTQGTWG